MPKIYDAAMQAFNDIEAKQAKGGVDLMGITTGFKDLDYVLGGFRKDNLYILGGASGHGKTACAVSMAMPSAEQGAHVLYASLEMSATMMALRMLSGVTGIHALKLERGRIDNDQLKIVREAVEEFKKMNFTILDKSYTSMELLEDAAKYKNKYGLDFVVADYASLFRDTGYSSLYEKETNISLNMREMARVLDIPVLTLVQLNRNRVGRENPRPVPSDVKQTGGYEQDASALMFIYRPYVQQMLEESLQPAELEDDAEIIVVKNRHGPPGTAYVNFHAKQMRWADKESNIELPPHDKERVKR